MFAAYEDVDVLAELSLLVGDAVANPGIERPEGGQGVGDGHRRSVDFDRAVTGGEFAKGAGDVKGDGHGYFLAVFLFALFVACDLRLVEDFVGGGALDSFMIGRTGMTEPSSTTPVRKQTMEGRPSRILCQFFPSSREPKS